MSRVGVSAKSRASGRKPSTLIMTTCVISACSVAVGVRVAVGRVAVVADGVGVEVGVSVVVGRGVVLGARVGVEVGLSVTVGRGVVWGARVGVEVNVLMMAKAGGGAKFAHP